jgi:hypothetical protein
MQPEGVIAERLKAHKHRWARTEALVAEARELKKVLNMLRFNGVHPGALGLMYSLFYVVHRGFAMRDTINEIGRGIFGRNADGSFIPRNSDPWGAERVKLLNQYLPIVSEKRAKIDRNMVNPDKPFPEARIMEQIDALQSKDWDEHRRLWIERNDSQGYVPGTHGPLRP